MFRWKPNIQDTLPASPEEQACLRWRSLSGLFEIAGGRRPQTPTSTRTSLADDRGRWVVAFFWPKDFAYSLLLEVAMATIAITGATGYIGRHLVTRLVAQGERPRCLVRPRSDLGRMPAGRNRRRSRRRH